MPRRAAVLDVGGLLAGLAAPSAPEEDGVATALLDATSGLLGCYGLKRWSLDDVAERSGVGRTTLYRHFPSREALVNAALVRDVRRFFTAIASAVSAAGTVEDQVVEGFVVGLRAVQGSLIPGLAGSDPSLFLPLITAPAVLDAARSALVEAYMAHPDTPRRVGSTRRGQVELVAEVLVRLAITFVLMPQSVMDLDDDLAIRRDLRRLIRPLLETG